MVRIYKFKYYNIYSNHNNGFIVHNTMKDFQNGHTHLNNYNTAKYLIRLSYYHRIPDHLSEYIIDSLIRISNNKDYIDQLYQIKSKMKKRHGKVHH